MPSCRHLLGRNEAVIIAAGGAAELVVVGAGIVGLATAEEALRRRPGLRVVVLEKEPRLAAHQSSRNSGVIHSGIYYRPGSLKARACVEGAAAMKEFCRRHALPLVECGKVVVACDTSELPGLEELRRRGEANGVPGLSLVGPERLREIEPHAAGVAALHVPGAAITDYGQVARRLGDLVTAAGGEVVTGARLLGVEERGGRILARTTAGAFAAEHLINCAGLHSDRVAAMAGLGLDLMIVPFRGEYYELAASRRDLVRGLVYPVPDPALPFLGVHLTRRVGGGVLAGPNAVLAFKREGYRRAELRPADAIGMLAFPGFWRMARRHWRAGLDEMIRSLSRRAFLRALQRLVPELRAEDLVEGAAGVRAQAVDRSGALVDDFRFLETDRMTHVLNVPSPAATASLVIARAIVDRVAPRLRPLAHPA